MFKVKDEEHFEKTIHLTEESTDNSLEQLYRPIHLHNIPLPSTGGHVLGKSLKKLAFIFNNKHLLLLNSYTHW